MTNHDHLAFSRRRFLTSTAATAGLLAGTSLVPVMGKAPMLNTQAPPFYRFKIGSFEATVVSDGPLNLGEPKAEMFPGVSQDELSKALTGHFLPTDQVVVEQNALVVNTGDRLVLFDTGVGSVKIFGDKSGRLLSTLKSAGFDPKDIDAVVLTHAHPDHCWALMADDGTRNFANAQIYIAQADFDFWTDEAKLSNDVLKNFIAGTRKHLMPSRDRMVFVKDGGEVLPGIQAMAAPGHTVGHTIYMITSQGKTLCNAGDIGHHPVLSTEKPRVQFAYDTDGKQAADSRVRVFDMLAAQRIPLLAYHFPWPGIGYLAKQGDGFRYFASPMQMAL
jgi:glyoxylase-like metal-dependent hydrolase (beta-lactamase superfamily II)